MGKLPIIIALSSLSVLMLCSSNIALDIRSLPVINVTETPNPALSPANWYYTLALAPLIAYIARELLGLLKNRHWKKKYRDVIVAKPL